MSLGLHEAALPPVAIRRAAARFRRLEGADVVWLGVRESRSGAVVIRWANGIRSSHGLGLRIEPGVGAGGAVLVSGRPRFAAPLTDGCGLSGSERSLLTREATAAVMVLPLKSAPLGESRDPRLEGLAYVARRDGRSFREETVAEAMRLGERVALPVRNAQRLQEASRRLAHAEAAAGREKTPEHYLYEIAQVIAAEARVLMRSGIGIVFRLDRTSGALHSLGVEGADLPELRRGQVLPPGCGSAGRAVATRAPFVARDYGSGAVRVPPIMSNALPGWVPFTTLSVPLFSMHEVIGALTVARASDLPYSPDDVRLAERMAAEAAPFLARAQYEAETSRRQQGASELSRFAGSLTQTLSASAVSERLVRGVISLVRGTEAAVWDPQGRITTPGAAAAFVWNHSESRLQRILQLVMTTQRPFWTPDLSNDPRLAEPGRPFSLDGVEHRAVLAVPVRINDSLVAILGVSSQAGRAFSETDVELVQGLADLAALAIANARAYHDLELSRAAVLRHEKLVVAGRLAAGLAHELRNPLQNAVGFIVELKERSSIPTLLARREFEEFPPLLKHVHAELRRAATIVDRLLDYVRERKAALESVDVRQVIAEAVALVSTTAAAGGGRITVSPGDTPLRVQADAVMLKQVVLNILGNALDALEGEGSIDVGARLEPDPAGPGRVAVTVRDTGRGIPPENLPNVFDLFYTTKEVGRGVGLGLAVCQAMIEQHGGTITITSPGVGKGTAVVFELPAER